MSDKPDYFAVFWSSDGSQTKAVPVKQNEYPPKSFTCAESDVPTWAAKYAIFKFDPIAEATIEQGQDVKIKEAKAQSENSTVTY